MKNPIIGLWLMATGAVSGAVIQKAASIQPSTELQGARYSPRDKSFSFSFLVRQGEFSARKTYVVQLDKRPDAAKLAKQLEAMAFAEIK